MNCLLAAVEKIRNKTSAVTIPPTRTKEFSSSHMY
jgi:hypothetical protein